MEAELAAKAGKIVAEVDEVVGVLHAASRQAEWQLISKSLANRFDYWLQHSYPSDIVASGAAETVDAKLWEAAVACMDLRVESDELG